MAQYHGKSLVVPVVPGPSVSKVIDVREFNPNHDAQGRFASAGGGGGKGVKSAVIKRTHYGGKKSVEFMRTYRSERGSRSKIFKNVTPSSKKRLGRALAKAVKQKRMVKAPMSSRDWAAYEVPG